MITFKLLRKDRLTSIVLWPELTSVCAILNLVRQDLYTMSTLTHAQGPDSPN